MLAEDPTGESNGDRRRESQDRRNNGNITALKSDRACDHCADVDNAHQDTKTDDA